MTKKGLEGRLSHKIVVVGGKILEIASQSLFKEGRLPQFIYSFRKAFTPESQSLFKEGRLPQRDRF